MLAEIIGPDLLIVIALIALLFGGSQLPKLARSLGTAKSEFEKGLQDAGRGDPAPPAGGQQVTMTRAELDALLAEREARGREQGGPTTA
ncbi:MAG: twin-arginine translocase TatA/TatE family subunit [Acidimicrobiales bacterium]